jgi:hypothetical protein
MNNQFTPATRIDHDFRPGIRSRLVEAIQLFASDGVFESYEDYYVYANIMFNKLASRAN